MRRALILLALIACKPHHAGSGPSAASSSSAAGPNSPNSPNSIDPPAFTSGPITIAPPIAMARPTEPMQMKVQSAGWMKDSSAVVVCTNVGCTHTTPDGKDEPWPQHGDEAKAAEWPYADDLALTWQLHGLDKLEVGAVVKNDRFGTPPIAIPAAGGGHVFPELISISPDGKWLAAVAHETGKAEAVTTKIVPVSVAAGRAYNFSGLELHEKGDYKNAVPLLLKGSFADPEQTLAPYNLACALARTKDPRTRAALALAFTRDPSLKKKAQTDKDLDDVRTEPWFASVVQ